MGKRDTDGYKDVFAQVIIRAVKDLSLSWNSQHRTSAENFLDNSPELKLYLEFLFSGDNSGTTIDFIIDYLSQLAEQSRDRRIREALGINGGAA